MSGHALAHPRGSLVDAVLPGVHARVNVALVTGGALLVALLAQVQIPLGFTPVPITGQTFAVVLVAGSLGAQRGAASLLLYVLLGAIGLPFFAGGEGGAVHVFGATGGYLVGFVPAAALIGWLAERGLDRSPWKAFLVFQAGSLIVFGLGMLGLILTLGVTPAQAANLGWFPFVPGDLIKSALAAGLFPASWLLVERWSSKRD
jgi:biotin transport system substrate-specific component